MFRLVVISNYSVKYTDTIDITVVVYKYLCCEKELVYLE